MHGIVLALVLILFGAGHALAYEGAVEDFAGLWENVDRHPEGVIRIAIRAHQQDRVSVEAVGRCGRRECEYGTAPGQLFRSHADSAGDGDTAAILVRFDRGNVAGNVLLRLNRRGTMVSHALLTFRDTGEKIYRVERFQRARGYESDERYLPRRRYGDER